MFSALISIKIRITATPSLFILHVVWVRFEVFRMHQFKKRSNWHFGMNAHFDVDVDPLLTYGVVTIADNLSSITHARARRHGDETPAFSVIGYQVVEMRHEMRAAR